MYIYKKQLENMKSIITIAITLFTAVSMNAQANFFNEAIRWNKFIDRVNSPKGQQLNYSDIEGDAYFGKYFITANIENATSLIKTRYNMYTDTVELMNEQDIFELPKSQKYSRISFLKPTLVLTYVTTGNIPMGYYFELATGKYTLLKKMQVEFREGSPAVNSFTPAIAPKFENLKPIYYLKSDSEVIKLTKNVKDLANAIPDKKEEINDFVKKNNIKLNQDLDLIRLANFINASK